MRALPDGWPAASDAATNDDVEVSIPDATWLSGPQVVDSFSVKRELVGSLLPGQIRAASGLSVASGDCTFAYSPTDGSPWLHGSPRVRPAGTASLYATANDLTVPLGTFSVDEVAGQLSQSTLSLTLIDEKLANRHANRFNPTASGVDLELDSAYIVDMLARDLGYYSTPAPVVSAVLSAPFNGTAAPESGRGVLVSQSAPIAAWDHRFDTLSPAMDVTVEYSHAALPMTDFYVTATVDGIGVFAHAATGADIQGIIIAVDDGVLQVKNNAASSPSFATGSYIVGDDPNHPDRVEVECQRIGKSGAWTAVQVRARSSAISEWGEWVTESTASTTAATAFTESAVEIFDSVIGVQLTPTQDAGVWAVPTASVWPLGNTLQIVVLPPVDDSWNIIQAVVASALGAAFIDAGEKLLARDFEWLRGGRPTDGVLEVLDDLDDLDWVVSAQDAADRVEVSYRPPDVVLASPTVDPTVWTAEEAYTIAAHGSIDIVIDAPSAVDGILSFVQQNETTPTEKNSQWTARANRAGGGAQAAVGALTFAVARTGSTRFVLTITNTTGANLSTVNNDGDPVLILRAAVSASQETAAVLASGVDAEFATNPLTVDLGIYCQSDVDAARALQFITSQTQKPKFKVSQATVPFDWRRELGDVYTLVHEGVHLAEKVLCVGIDLDGAPGQYVQKVDLVLLETTVYDFNAAWDAALPGATIADFDAVWSGQTFEDFNLDPLKTS